MASRLWQPKLSYKCACCGDLFKGSPSFAYLRPSYYYDVPKDEREARVKLSNDLCHIRATVGQDSDDDIYAIRCTLDIPIIDVKDPFCWGVWVSQSRNSFERYIETYALDQSNSSSFGWLVVNMPHYNRSLEGEFLESLPCDVKWGEKGQRPMIILHESDHPLYRDQTQGIGWGAAVAIAQTYLKVAHNTAGES